MTLIERLRYAEKRAPNYGDLMLDAANTINEQCIEINKLRAELAAIKAQAGGPTIEEYQTWLKERDDAFNLIAEEVHKRDNRIKELEKRLHQVSLDWQVKDAALKAQMCEQEPVALMHAAWLEKSLTIGAPEAAAELRRLHEIEKKYYALKAQAFTHTDEPIVRIGDKLYVQNEGGYLMGEVVPTTERRETLLDAHARQVEAEEDGEPVAWMNKRGDVISAEEKTLIIENGKLGYPGGEFDLHAKNIERSYTIPLGVINV